MIDALREIEVVSLFVEDLPSARAFYVDVFGMQVVYTDDVSVVMTFGNVLINLLETSAARELVEPAAVARPGLGSRLVFTVKVADVDAVCAELGRHGVALLNGPADRPWGRRTAAFADPAGNVWEIAQELHRADADAASDRAARPE